MGRSDPGGDKCCAATSRALISSLVKMWGFEKAFALLGLQAQEHNPAVQTDAGTDKTGAPRISVGPGIGMQTVQGGPVAIENLSGRV